jgi:hypothetical protein
MKLRRMEPRRRTPPTGKPGITSVIERAAAGNSPAA